MKGGFLKAYRQDLGLSQEQFAAKLGISQGHLCRLEKGKCEIPRYIENQITMVDKKQWQQKES